MLSYYENQTDYYMYPLLAWIVICLSFYVILVIAINRDGRHVPIVILLKFCVACLFGFIFMYEMCFEDSQYKLLSALANYSGIDRGY